MESESITKDQLKIRVHHVGGIGDCGPTKAIEMLGNDVDWVIYDASEEALTKSARNNNSHYLLVNSCLGGNNTKAKFHVMLAKSASSTLKPAASAAKYTLITGWGKGQIWGEHTRIVKSVDTEISTIDSLVDDRKVPSVDFLSIDAQGSDFDIINGASKMLTSSIIGVLCEVEFTELYAGQPLFCDIQDRLRKEGFRLCQIFNNQYWNTAPYVNELQGAGFYTVGEALFFRDANALINVDSGTNLSSTTLMRNVVQSIKLAAIAVVFDQLDFALGILRSLQNKNILSLEELAEKTDVNYIKMLSDLYHAADIIEASKPPLVYESSNSDDWKINKYRKMKNYSVLKIKRLLKLITPRLVLRIVKSAMMKTNRGCSTINKIYKDYGLYELIK